MTILFGYVLLGLSLSAPIGPVNAAQIDAGIKRGFAHAWLVGIGAMAADIIYMALVYLGFVHFIATPFIKTFLWSFGAFVLIYSGIESLQGARKLADVRADSGPETGGYRKTLASGFLMSLSNPMTILFWLGIYGSVLAEKAAGYELTELAAASAAIIAGIAIWDLSMAAATGFFRKRLSSRLLAFISVVSGLSLLGYGAYFGFEAFRLLLTRAAIALPALGV